MVRAHPWMKAARLSNRPVKLSTAGLNTVVLANCRRELQNRLEGLGLDGNVFRVDERRGIKDAVVVVVVVVVLVVVVVVVVVEAWRLGPLEESFPSKR